MGYALRRRWLPQGVASLLWNQWQLCRGMRGNFAMESVASFAWNRWQLSYGTGGNFRAEYAAIQLAEMADRWDAHPSRAQQRIAWVRGVDHMWPECHVPLNACVIRFWNTKKQRTDHIGWGTTDQAL